MVQTTPKKVEEVGYLPLDRLREILPKVGQKFSLSEDTFHEEPLFRQEKGRFVCLQFVQNKLISRNGSLSISYYDYEDKSIYFVRTDIDNNFMYSAANHFGESVAKNFFDVDVEKSISTLLNRIHSDLFSCGFLQSNFHSNIGTKNKNVLEKYKSIIEGLSKSTLDKISFNNRSITYINNFDPDLKISLEVDILEIEEVPTPVVLDIYLKAYGKRIFGYDFYLTPDDEEELVNDLNFNIDIVADSKIALSAIFKRQTGLIFLGQLDRQIPAIAQYARRRMGWEEKMEEGYE